MNSKLETAVISVTHGMLRVNKSVNLTTQAQLAYQVQFTFDSNSEWATMTTKTAIFQRGSLSYAVILDSDNCAAFPVEILNITDSAQLYVDVGLLGVDSTIRLPSNKVRFKVMPSTQITGTQPEITETIYQQLVNLINGKPHFTQAQIESIIGTYLTSNDYVTATDVDDDIAAHNTSNVAHSARFDAKVDKYQGTDNDNKFLKVINGTLGLQTISHTELYDRNNANQHEIGAIINLQSTLDNKYVKPDDGIPKSHLSSSVQASLEKADTAVQTETDPTVPSWAKAATKPTYTKSEIGLDNVDNTSDINKPISTAVQTALNDKVDKIAGKGLSTNDYTTPEQTKLSGIEAGAEVNILEVVKVNDIAQTVTDKTINITIPTKTSDITNNSDFVSDNSYVHTDNNYTTVEKNKLSGIDEYANNYTLPVAGSDLGGIKSGTDIAVDNDGNVTVLDDSHNHIISNVDGLQTELNSKINSSEKGVASGVATLDSNAKVPLSQINDALIGNVDYQGSWNAATNTPTLSSVPTNKGYYYIVSTGGTQFGITFEVGDWIIANNDSWGKIDNTDAVSSVAGRTGNIVLTKTDVGLGNVDNTSDADKPISTAAQTALNAKQNTLTASTGINLNNNNISVKYDNQTIVTDTNGNFETAIGGYISQTATTLVNGDFVEGGGSTLWVRAFESGVDLEITTITMVCTVIGSYTTSDSVVHTMSGNYTFRSDIEPNAYIYNIVESNTDGFTLFLYSKDWADADLANHAQFKGRELIAANITVTIDSNTYHTINGNFIPIDGTTVVLDSDNKLKANIVANPSSVSTADLSKIAIGNTVYGIAWGSISGTLSNQSDLNTALNDKVDKVVGKSLSTNDYTTTEKNKLSGIEDNANNYILPIASSTLGGIKSGTDITVDNNGNVSVNDDSHNHIISNIDNLQTTLDNKQSIPDEGVVGDGTVIDYIPKPDSATANNFAKFNASKEVIDSGLSSADFLVADADAVLKIINSAQIAPIMLTGVIYN